MKKIVLNVFLLILTTLILASCASKIRLQAQRTPNLDTAGIQRIAVMPFTVATNNELDRQIAQHATNVATQQIQGTGQFQLVSASEIERLRRDRQNIEGHVDALFVGRVTRITSRDSSAQGERTNRETGLRETYVYFIREVEIEFQYQIERARDASIIGPVLKRGSTRVTALERADLRSENSLLQGIVNSQMRQLHRDVAPYTITITRTLERERNDRTVQDQLKAVEQQVKTGNYRAALESYLNIFDRTNNIPAAINASILFEAIGETQAAADFMFGVHLATGNPRARDVLNRLNRELQEQAGVAGHLATLNPIDRVTAHTSEEIRRVLPARARVWIHNAYPTNAMVNAVVDNLTADFIRRGVGIVDRQNIALIEAEQRFHASGSVTDDDFMRVGNAAGASIIVTVNMSGTGAMRRLQVRVLDIERTIPILQSDTSEVWRL